MSHPQSAWIDDTRQRSAFRRRLLAWYRKHRRDLPWRRRNDPYAVWLSEVMLQQTRVETARGYFERFLERFPTLTDLAVADEEDVLKAWEGLGYYSRARNLHRTARTVVEDHGGALLSIGPVAALQHLPQAQSCRRRRGHVATWQSRLEPLP